MFLTPWPCLPLLQAEMNAAAAAAKKATGKRGAAAGAGGKVRIPFTGQQVLPWLCCRPLLSLAAEQPAFAWTSLSCRALLSPGFELLEWCQHLPVVC